MTLPYFILSTAFLVIVIGAVLFGIFAVVITISELAI